MAARPGSLESAASVHFCSCSIHPRVSASVVAGFLKGIGVEEPVGDLTPREREVLQLIAEGMTNREIASHLRLSVKTVEAHRTAMMKKLELHGVAELTRWAIRRGIVTPE